MRQIGTVTDEAAAAGFADYLIVNRIEYQLDAQPEGVEIWIVDEDRLTAAREMLQRYQADPQAAEFQKLTKQATAIRKEREQKLSEQLKRRKAEIRDTNPSALAMFPVTIMLIVASIVVTMIETAQGTPYGLTVDLSITAYRPASIDRIFNYKNLPEIWSGEIWRLFTPIFTHFGPVHLIFNMLAMFHFGSKVEMFLKPWRYTLFVLFCAAAGNLSQFYVSGPQFGGISGVGFALFGFLWMKTVYDPQSGLFLPRQSIYFGLGFFALCLTGIIGPIANMAHFAGLVSGCGFALAAPGWRWLRGVR